MQREVCAGVSTPVGVDVGDVCGCGGCVWMWGCGGCVWMWGMCVDVGDVGDVGGCGGCGGCGGVGDSCA